MPIMLMCLFTSWLVLSAVFMQNNQGADESVKEMFEEKYNKLPKMRYSIVISCDKSRSTICGLAVKGPVQ